MFGGHIGYLMLRLIAPRSHSPLSDELPLPDLEFKQIFGNDFLDTIREKTVIDFGCGTGKQAVVMALMGAKVIGIDIQERGLAIGRALAQRLSVADRCTFTTKTNESADVIISKDAFEHFSDPSAVLKTMSLLLKKDGCIFISFGPPWLHPLGGHLFSVFPWAHLVFTEKALIRWRSDFKSDDAARFSEVEGGLNQLTIKQFERFVENSPLKFEWLDVVPIKGLSFLKHKAFREIGSSVVRCKLILKDSNKRHETIN